MNLKRVTPYSCELAKEGAMRVPGRVYLSPALETALTDGSLDQVANVAKLPGIVDASIAMPDMHIGYGFPVGGVAAFDAEQGIISPGGIGFDINCGVRMLTTDLRAEQVQPLIEELMVLLERAIPTGTGRDSSVRLEHAELDRVLTMGSAWALEKGYATQDDIDKTEEYGRMAADANAVSSRAKDRGVNQLGTLGAGNHFLEVQVVEEILDEEKARVFGITGPGQVVIMIHCGSRGVGHQVCTDYLQLMEDAYPDIAASLPEKNLLFAPVHSDLGQRYYKAMCAAANFAWCNRQLIAHHTRKAFQRLFPGCSVKQLYDVSHNIAKHEQHHGREVYVHRKGATRSFGPGHADVPEAYRATGQPVLIPGSMGTASYVLAGAQGAMAETFGSCCHGAGRMMSRTAALNTLKGETIRKELSLQGVHVQVRSVKGLAEEAPQAYKDVHEVIRVVSEAGLAIPVARMKPLGVLKG